GVGAGGRSVVGTCDVNRRREYRQRSARPLPGAGILRLSSCHLAHLKWLDAHCVASGIGGRQSQRVQPMREHPNPSPRWRSRKKFLGCCIYATSVACPTESAPVVSSSAQQTASLVVQASNFKLAVNAETARMFRPRSAVASLAADETIE